MTGPATVYDIASGLLGDLRSTGNYSQATCLAFGLTQSQYTDTRGNPPSGSGDYYLVRGRNGCGSGGYGDSGLVPDPRTDLDLSGPCP